MTRTKTAVLASAAFLAMTATVFAPVSTLGIAAAGAAKASSLLAPDKGSFRILLNGQPMGKEEFEISPSGGGWVAKGTSEVQTSEGTAHVTGTLQLQDDGTPVSYEWSTQGAKKASSSITFSGKTATIEVRLEERRPFTQQFTFNSAPIVVLDNNLYYQYAVLARLYDHEKKGVQTFSVLVPQELTPGSVTVESRPEHDDGGNKKLEELVVKTEALEVELYLDGGRLMRIVSPSSNAEIVRQ